MGRKIRLSNQIRTIVVVVETMALVMPGRKEIKILDGSRGSERKDGSV